MGVNHAEDDGEPEAMTERSISSLALTERRWIKSDEEPSPSGVQISQESIDKMQEEKLMLRQKRSRLWKAGPMGQSIDDLLDELNAAAEAFAQASA